MKKGFYSFSLIELKKKAAYEKKVIEHHNIGNELLFLQEIRFNGNIVL